MTLLQSLDVSITLSFVNAPAFSMECVPMMFEQALKANLPIIGVQTDDPVNFRRVLAYYSNPRPLAVYDKKTKQLGSHLYYSTDEDVVSTDTYEEFRKFDLTLVIQNPSKGNPLIFDAGILPTPEPMVRALIADITETSAVEFLYPALRGLSLRAVYEVIMLTQARADKVTAVEIRRTRASLFGSTQGLFTEDTSYDFYLWPEGLKEWLELNKDYFLKQVHAKLVPRGLMFEGLPGVGKSMAAKAIANVFGVPLYRFDIAATLDKYIGVSEGRVAKVLALVDREAPCVLLLDEIEKVFQQTDESGVIKRMMSQLLWWLAEHQSRVFTVMTTNDKSGVPPEMYREGRIDKVMQIFPLPMKDAVEFSKQVFFSVVSKPPEIKQLNIIKKALQSIAGKITHDSEGHPYLPNEDHGYHELSHAVVAEIVYTEVKRNHWA